MPSGVRYPPPGLYGPNTRCLVPDRNAKPCMRSGEAPCQRTNYKQIAARLNLSRGRGVCGAVWSQSSTLAITSRNTPRQLGALRRPQDFLRVGFPQRPAKTSRPRRVPAAVGRRVLRKVGREGAKAVSHHGRYSIGAKSTSRSALLEHWGEQPIYPFRSQMAKVEPRETVRKGFLRE